jgi:plasmid stabilization system protein ParE
MKYTVIVMRRAQADIALAREYIAEHSPTNAANWVKAIYKEIESLEKFPHGLSSAREQSHYSIEIRQVVVKSYRIIFTIDDATKTVYVVTVRHAKMRAIGEDEET